MARFSARKKKILFSAVAVTIVVLVVITALYVSNQMSFDRSGLVGDKVCGNFESVGERDNCCWEAHSGDETPLCSGNWAYRNDKCEFVCFGDDSPERDVCINAGGEWKTLANGCVDSCEVARNPEVISCIQALTQGCDCGADMCWTGSVCEPN